MSQTIRTAILSINTPFNIDELFWLMNTQYHIADKKLISKILLDLYKAQTICYIEIKKDCWAFIKKGI